MMAPGLSSAIDRSVDVAVVGGGPAGSAAAIWSALSGLDTVLLEAQPFPRPRPGESLHPGAMAILRQLGVDHDIEQAGFVRYPGQIVAWGGEPEFQSFGSDAGGAWLGLQATREKLDAILLHRARALGVEVLQPCGARAPLLTDGRVAGVDSSSGPIRARIVIDAAGGRHWLGRRLGSGVYSASPQLIAYYGYAKAERPVPEVLPHLVADAAGWTWIAPVGEDSYAWTCLPFTAPPAGRPGLPPALRGCIPTAPIRGADVTWRFLLPPAGPGYFIAGDAAAVLDPLSSRGVLKALMTGMQAAHLASLVLRKGIDESRAIQSYQDFCLRLFESEVAGMHDMYARLPREWQPFSTHRSSSGEMPWPRPS